jgi:dUTP pyrophosphatase
MNAASAADEAVWDREMVIALSDTEKSGDRTPVKIRLLNPLASVPQNAKQGDAGFDLRSVVDATVPAGGTLVIPTGVAIEIPSDTVALVCSRSGMAAKQSVAVLNAPGVIDSGYRGELLVVLHNHGSEPFPVSVGDRIAQLMIQHYLVPHFELVDELGESERGTAGKGSTGLA